MGKFKIEKITSIFFIFYTFFISFSAYSQQADPHSIKRDLKGSITQNFTSQAAHFSISSHKSRYRNFEDISLFLQIKNRGDYPITLYMHKNYLRNFTIVVRDNKGRSLPMKDIFYRERNQLLKNPFFENYTGTTHHSRAIILQPNEIFKRRLVLQEIVDITKKESHNIEKFQIQGYFYPNPEQAPHIFIKSDNHYQVYIDVEQNLLRSRQTHAYDDVNVTLTPKEIVYLTLSAEYAGEWSNFFKYLSIPDIIKDYSEYAKQYIRAPRNQKAIVLQNFRAYLKNRDTHRLLDFRIIQGGKNKYLTKQSKKIALVQVKADREIQGFRRKFLYTYYLTNIQPLWKITGIESQLLE